MTEPRREPVAGTSPGRVIQRLKSADDDREDVTSGQDEVLIAVVLDLGAAVLAVDDLVADGNVERNAVAVVVDAAGTDRQDLALLGLLLGGVRDHEARGSGLLGLAGLDDDAVFEGLMETDTCDLPFGNVEDGQERMLCSERCVRSVLRWMRGSPSRGSTCSLLAVSTCLWRVLSR